MQTAMRNLMASAFAAVAVIVALPAWAVTGNMLSHLSFDDAGSSGLNLLRAEVGEDAVVRATPTTPVAGIGDIAAVSDATILSGLAAGDGAAAIPKGQHFAVPIPAALTSAAGRPYTVIMRIRVPDTVGWRSLLNMPASNDTDAMIYLQRSTRNVYLKQFDKSSGAGIAAYNGNVAADQWTTLTFAFGENTTDVYRDGTHILHTDGALAGSYADCASAGGFFLVGADDDGDDDLFYLSDFRVYDGAVSSTQDVNYYDPTDGAMKTCLAYATFTGQTTLTSGWYAVMPDTTAVDERIMVCGDVNLVLCDGAELNAMSGISVAEGNSLTIWGQGGEYIVPGTAATTCGTGTLNAWTGGDQAAAIGGAKAGATGNIVINGGIVVANGNWGAGIGGGDVAVSSGSVTINGGHVVATGNNGSAGIGGGGYANGCDVTISGGYVVATGSVYNNQATPGIGSGRPKANGSQPLISGTITITGGTVVAQAGAAPDGGIVAQAIGVNSADAANNGTGRLTLGPVMAFGSENAAEPVPALARGDACRGVWVKIEVCTSHLDGDADNFCDHCGTFCGPVPDIGPDGVITIGSTDDWNVFAACVNAGVEACKDKTVQLTADICVTTMMGTVDYPFSGVFNGNGHTLTVTINGAEECAAPFRQIDGATIENLVVAGTVTSSGYHAAGLVGGCRSARANTIKNCVVATTVNGSGYAGGIVGHGGEGTLTMRNCVFSGAISGFNAYAGGLMGWCDALTLLIADCLTTGTFTPVNGGKYHPVACKFANSTVIATAARTYYLNTLMPTATGGNLIPDGQGEPVSATSIDGTWDEPVTAADGITYYAPHVTGKKLPYSCAFENSSVIVSDGWSVVNAVGGTGYSYYNAFAFEPTVQGDQYLISPELDSRNAITMTFKHYRFEKGEEPPHFQVGYSVTTKDIGSFIWDNEISRIPAYWESYTRTYPRGTKYVAVKALRVSGNPGANLRYLYLDDFSFTVCNDPAPVRIEVSGLTETSASLTWVRPQADEIVTGYAYQFKKASDAEWSAETTVNGNTVSVTIDGLQAWTAYQFRVKALYANGESIYLPIDFTTSKALPYECGFEDGLDGWSMVDCAWDLTKISAEATHDGEYGFNFWSTTYAPQYLVSPLLPDDSAIAMSFYYRSQPGAGITEKFQVGYSTTTANIDSFVWGTETFFQNGNWSLYETRVPAGTRYIAVRYNVANGSRLHLDDIRFERYSAYALPTALAAGSLTEHGAVLTWVAPGPSVTGYAYQYKKAGDATWSAESTVNTTSATLSGLSAETTYNFRVRALYGGNASNYATISFTTEGEIASLPHFQGFENGMNGWRIVDGDSVTEIYNNSDGFVFEGDNSFKFAYASAPQYLISPRFDGTLAMTVSFYTRHYSNLYPAKFQLGFSTTTRDPAAFTWTDEIEGSSAWTRYVVNIPKGVTFIAIKCVSGMGLYFDNFSIEGMGQIDLADGADNASTIAACNGKTMASVRLLGRTLTADSYWDVLTLPFNLDSLTGTPLEQATVKTLNGSSFSDGTLTLSFGEAVSSIEAGKPYVVKWSDAAALQIQSVEDWNAFAAAVAGGRTFKGKTVLLLEDIGSADHPVTNMVGSSEHPFCGYFDGRRNNITVDINVDPSEVGAAPFRYIRGATIQNLGVGGKVRGGNHCAGIVGIASGGTNVIRNCASEVEVVARGDYVGGILGNGGASTTTIHDCMCYGMIRASNSRHVGVFYGWGEAGGTHTVRSSLAGGYFLSYNEQSIDLLLAGGGACSVTRCYRTTLLCSQGTYVESEFNNPEMLAGLGDQWEYQGEGAYLTIKSAPCPVTYLSGITQDPVFPIVTVSDSTNIVQTEFADFIGNTSPVLLAGGDRSTLSFGVDNSLVYPENVTTINSCRAYFRLKGLSAGAAVKRYVLDFGDEIVTGEFADAPVISYAAWAAANGVTGAWDA